MNLWKTVFVVFIAALQVSATSYNVKDFGATGDKRNYDDSAIQKAINVCTNGGGGTVYFPSGNYLIGNVIELKSNVQIYLDTGAILWESPDSAVWRNDEKKYLFYAFEAKHFSIIGPGTIHGTGKPDLRRRSGVEEPWPSFRVGLMKFENCKDILLRDITIKYSSAWTLNLTLCENVRIDAVTIDNNFYRVNTDGIIPVASKNIMISNCRIRAGDDCIVMKNPGRQSCENIVIDNCILETVSTAIKIGTESFGDFRDIHISNCTIRNSGVGIGIFIKDGAMVERLTATNVSIETTDPDLHTKSANKIAPLFIDIEKRREDSPIGRVRDIVFSDIQISSDMGILIQGMPVSLVENLTLSNIQFRVTGARDFQIRQKRIGGKRYTTSVRDTLYIRKPSYVTLAHVKGLHVDNLSIAVPNDVAQQLSYSAFSGHYLENAVLRDIMRLTGETITRPLMTLENCKDVLVSNSLVEDKSPILLELQGKETMDIMLNMPKLKKIKNKIVFKNNAPMQALIR